MFYNTDNQMNKQVMESRTAYFDVLKCLAIVFVVIGHVDSMKLEISTYDTLRGCIEYTFQMPLFFFISGIFANHGIDKGEPLLVLLWKKVKTLFWPALVFSCIYLLVKEGRVGIPTTGLGCFWFTFTLFECFVIYYVFAYLLRGHRKLLNVLLAFISVGFVVMLALKIDSTKIYYLDLNHLTKYFQYFYLGTLFSLFSKVGDKFLRNQLIYAVCLTTFCVLMYLIYTQTLSGIVFSLSRDIVVRYLGLYIVFSIFYNQQEACNNENLFMNAVRYIGRHSLEVYLLHFFFLPTLMWIVPLRDDSMFVVEFPIAIVISLSIIGFVLILNYILARNKYLSLLLYGKKMRV